MRRRVHYVERLIEPTFFGERLPFNVVLTFEI